ncbi:MAG: glucose-6-phosphate dehydrogenase, partial [Verrucomicrobiales bacterium]
MESNPFREHLVSRLSPEACTIVIFGATGDLTHRKLVPALYNIAADGDLPAGVSVVAFARREKTDEQLRNELKEANLKFSRQELVEEIWEDFASSLHYHCSEFQDLEGYRSLRERLEALEAENRGAGNRLFYLASAPKFFD